MHLRQLPVRPRRAAPGGPEWLHPEFPDNGFDNVAVEVQGLEKCDYQRHEPVQQLGIFRRIDEQYWSLCRWIQSHKES